MKNITTLILIALFALGCSNTRSQTPAQTAQDVAQDGASEEYRSDDGYFAGSEEQNEQWQPQVDGSGDASRDDVATGSGDDGVEGAVEGSITGAAFGDELIGSSWSEAANEAVYEAVLEQGGFGDAAVIPLAHISRGTRHVVIAWPALSGSGELTSASVYGVCVEDKGEGSFESCAERWVVNEVTSARANLESALGGSDYQVITNQSAASLAAIGPQLTDLGNAVVAAAAQGEAEALFQRAQEFMQLLPVEEVAFSNVLPQLLVTAARNQKEFVHVKTEQGDQLATMTLKIRADWQDVTVMSLTAQQVEGSSGQWRVVDFW